MSSTPGAEPPRARNLLRALPRAIRQTRATSQRWAVRLTGAAGRRHTTRRVAIASALILAGGLTAGVAGIAAASGSGGSHPVTVDLAYSCRFPSAAYPVSAVATATFPASAAVGTPVAPAGLQLAITLPKQAVAYLRGLGAASVTATGSIGVTATSRGTPVSLFWPVQTAAAAALPDATSVTLDTAGTATPTAASATGTVTFTTAGLTLLLTPRTASDASTSPADVAASCATTTASRLASVSVTSATASASQTVRNTTKPAKKPPPKKNRFPKGCGDIKVHGYGEAVCGYIDGYSDVKKLYGATLIGPVLVNIDFAYRHVIKHGKLIAYSSGRIYDQADKGKPMFPPVRSTFLGFGFVPVTATLTLTELGPISIVSSSGITAPPYPITVTAKSRVAIAISDVTVNGQPLPVGAGCRPEHPSRLTLTGHGTNTSPPRGYTVPTGGPLSGFLTIPKFVHCGVAQNLDPLLTGSISGPGDFAKLTQGRLCGPSNPQDWTCPPPKPKPIR